MPIVLKSGNLNLLEPSGPVMGLLYLFFIYITRVYKIYLAYTLITLKILKQTVKRRNFNTSSSADCRSQWLRGLRRGSAAARLLRLWVRIPPGGMDVCCGCCVLSGRGLCDGLIIRGVIPSVVCLCVIQRPQERRG